MKYRSFNHGLHVSSLGVGCSRVGSITNAAPMRDIEAMFEAAVEAGVTHFDTANIYGQGDSERALGRLLRQHGDRLFVVTKIGGRFSRYAPLLRFAKPVLRAFVKSKPDLRKAVVAARTASVVHDFQVRDLDAALDDSRRRLNVDQLKALLLHNPSAEMLRRGDIGEFLSEVVRRGRAQCVGVSVENFETLEAAVALPEVSIIQSSAVVAENLPGSAALAEMQRRDIGLFVREILQRPAPDGMAAPAPRDALSAALQPGYVTSAIVGTSSHQHLRDLLPAVE